MAQNTSIRRVAFASFIGTTIEWYDYLIYGSAAALVFPKLFFPNFSAFAGTLASFATFGVGFFAGPVGGIVFGHFGDRVGRKSMLVATLLLMGTATFFVGLLPTFKTWGIFAPMLLVVLRFLQGFAVGGEWGGATLMAVEHAPDKDRTYYASWPQLGVPAGLMLSTAIFAVFTSVTKEHFLDWGWRIPFLLSFLLVAVGLFVRMRLTESPAFEQVKRLGAESKMPFVELVRDYPIQSILAVCIALTGVSGFYLATVFAMSYVTQRFSVTSTMALMGVLFAGTAEFVTTLVFARIADRIGKKTVAIWGAGCVVLFSYPYFWLLDTGRTALIWLAMSALLVLITPVYSIMGALFAELFATRVRYSGISFGYQMGRMIAGAPAPIIATALVHWSGGASWPVATYLAVTALVTFVAVCLVARKSKLDILEELEVQPSDA